MEAAGITQGYDVAMVELPTYVENLRMSTDGQDKKRKHIPQTKFRVLVNRSRYISGSTVFFVTAISTLQPVAEQKVKIAYSAARDSIYNKAVAAVIQ